MKKNANYLQFRRLGVDTERVAASFNGVFGAAANRDDVRRVTEVDVVAVVAVVAVSSDATLLLREERLLSVGVNAATLSAVKCELLRPRVLCAIFSFS